MHPDQLRRLVARPAFEHAVHGDAPTRHRYLLQLARTHAVGTARLVEAHLDACIILHEAGLAPVEDALYGVYASRGEVRLAEDDTLTGTKPFCSGLQLLDRALLTACTPDPDAGALVEIDLRGSTAAADLSGWHTPALAGTNTGTLELRGHPVQRRIGPPGWYLDRPGFWQGALRPAACWAGAATALTDVLVAMVDRGNPHAMAHLGAMLAIGDAFQALLDHAGREVDQAPHDVALAHRWAGSVRHVVERGATEILDRFGRALGPRPYVGDRTTADRVADLHLYLRQHHAEVDLADLAALWLRES